LTATLLAALAAGVPSHAASTCRSGYYLNVSHVCVKSPGSSAVGATAQCRDSTYSYSQHASGTCSGHGGVRVWIHHP
jgi:Protein of unknown function (DUF3761)